MGCVSSNYFQSVCQAGILPVISIVQVHNLVYRLCLKQYCFLKAVSLPNLSVYPACPVFVMVAKRESASILTRTPSAPCKIVNTRYKWFFLSNHDKNSYKVHAKLKKFSTELNDPIEVLFNCQTSSR